MSKYKPPKKLNKQLRSQGWEEVTCPTCRGTGQYHFKPCNLCEGTGKIRARK